MTNIDNIIKESIDKLITESQFSVNDKVWIAYGVSSYDATKFCPIEPNNLLTIMRNKPLGGLWASPVDSEYGWKDWCEHEDFHTETLSESFSFKLSPNAKIYVIDDIDDLTCISTQVNSYFPSQHGINFTKLLNSGYDGLFVTAHAALAFHNYINAQIMDLNSWDCESICIFNKKVIIPL